MRACAAATPPVPDPEPAAETTGRTGEELPPVPLPAADTTGRWPTRIPTPQRGPQAAQRLIPSLNPTRLPASPSRRRRR